MHIGEEVCECEEGFGFVAVVDGFCVLGCFCCEGEGRGEGERHYLLRFLVTLLLLSVLDLNTAAETIT